MLFHYTDDITSLDLTRKQQLSYRNMHATSWVAGGWGGVGRAVNPSDSYKLITSDPNAPFMNSFCGNTWEFRNTDAESQRITRRDKKAFLSILILLQAKFPLVAFYSHTHLPPPLHTAYWQPVVCSSFV